MRYLVPLTTLALVAACGDATAPPTGATPADALAESDAPNLRRAREALIDAGNVISAAIADDGVAGGLTGALAGNAILLSPRMPAIRGREDVAAFLAGDPLAPRALSWEVIVADVSADATQGYTWAQGSSTFDLGTGEASFPSYFLTYWRRAERGKWKIAAFVVNRGGPEPLPLPDGFGTPNRREGSSFPPSDEKELRSQLLSTDRAFSAYSVRHGSGPAFERFAAPKAIAVGETFIFGPEAIGQAFTGGPDDVVSWKPRFVDAAPTGDLGFTVGDAVFELAGIPPFYTKYLTVWQRRTNGQWRFIADLGNSRPAPAP